MTATPGTGTSVSIRGLCALWKAAATATGGISIGGESEQFRLHRNNVRFHELQYDQLREAVVGLTDVLLLPGMNAVIDLDHSLLWSWSAEVLMGMGAPLQGQTDPEIARLAAMTMRAALANVRPHTREAFDEARAASDLLDPNGKELLQRAHEVLPYLAFPLLEAFARRGCPRYVDLKGKVLSPFLRLNGRSYQVGNRCSSIGDLLKLIVDTVASPELSADMTEILTQVAELAVAADGYSVVFDWRNSSIHGETSLTTIGGTVLSLALLIALDGLRDDYPDHRQAASIRAQREVQTANPSARWQPSPFSFYPPFP